MMPIINILKRNLYLHIITNKNNKDFSPNYSDSKSIYINMNSLLEN